MAFAPFQSLTSPYVVLAYDNIDTDQIIPARFLKTTQRSGLGPHAFHDWRYDASGRPRVEFPLNTAAANGASVLVTGTNFGCGSSREHAVWALAGTGIRAVISTAFADIFRGNALGNGLLPVEVNEAAMAVLRAASAASPDSPPVVTIDLAAQSLTLPNGDHVSFPMASFAKHCLLHGVDDLDVLLEAIAEIERYETAHPPFVSTLARSPGE